MFIQRDYSTLGNNLLKTVRRAAPAAQRRLAGGPNVKPGALLPRFREMKKPIPPGQPFYIKQCILIISPLRGRLRQNYLKGYHPASHLANPPTDRCAAGVASSLNHIKPHKNTIPGEATSFLGYFIMMIEYLLGCHANLAISQMDTQIK